MGFYPPPPVCFITGLPTTHYSNDLDLIEYFIQLNDRNILFRFVPNFSPNEFVEKNKCILYGLLLNSKFPDMFAGAQKLILHNEELEAIINESVYPRTPEDKINNLLMFLNSKQLYEGSVIDIDNFEDKKKLSATLYFKNYDEMVFYLFTLMEQGLINGIDVSSMGGKDMINITLTYYGLNKIIELNESGVQSNRCFVAMSFSEHLNDIRAALKTALHNTGFEPILIDEIKIDSEETINDAIIAEIKKSKFVVADFTEQKHGVYFEAGFALGLKRPVIYLCRDDDFENSHFDTKHYPHIIYRDTTELTEKLILRIEAWIK